MPFVQKEGRANRVLEIRKEQPDPGYWKGMTKTGSKPAILMTKTGSKCPFLQQL